MIYHRDFFDNIYAFKDGFQTVKVIFWISKINKGH